MPQQKDCTPLHPNTDCDARKKRKKERRRRRKRTAASITRQENPHAVALHPETLPVSLLTPQSPALPGAPLPEITAAAGENGGGGRRSKRHPENLPANETSGASAVSELSAQARESLRWEGGLEDPQAEERRLELYRANRRQRYITHRAAELRESQGGLRLTSPKGLH